LSCDVKVKKTHPNAVIPTQNPGDVGWDLYAVEDCVIPPGESRQIKTGLTLAETPFDNDIHKTILLKIEGRSGMALNHSVFPIGGIIDPYYRGEVCPILYNGGKENYSVSAGDRTAQIVIYAVHAKTQSSTTSFMEVNIVRSSKRADKGFGSSGK
jgi:dUTP pyrophosphatase